MHDQHKSRPTTGQPDEVPSDIPEPDVRERDLPEGQIPGLPVSNDPLSQPMPRPQEREAPSFD
jgi:hypothetical protein